jgi:hypothetical protein
MLVQTGIAVQTKCHTLQCTQSVIHCSAYKVSYISVHTKCHILILCTSLKYLNVQHSTKTFTICDIRFEIILHSCCTMYFWTTVASHIRDATVSVACFSTLMNCYTRSYIKQPLADATRYRHWSWHETTISDFLNVLHSYRRSFVYIHCCILTPVNHFLQTLNEYSRPSI